MKNKPKFRIRLFRDVPPIESAEFRAYIRALNGPAPPRNTLENGRAFARGAHITPKGKRLLEEWRNSPNYKPIK